MFDLEFSHNMTTFQLNVIIDSKAKIYINSLFIFFQLLDSEYRNCQVLN